MHNAPLLDFLKYNNSEKLYLVGDIIDGWRLKRKWLWPQLHNDVVQKILRKARHGTKVIYVPGNHYEFARYYLDLSFGGIQVKDSDIHEKADGKKFWVVHDDFGETVTKALSLSRDDARAHAETYSWENATDIFEGFLVCRQNDKDYSVLNNPYKYNSGIKRAWHAFWNSCAGLRFAINEESAFRQELLLAAILIPLAIWLPASVSQTLLMIGSVFLVLIMERFNSSIEAAIDRISYEKHCLSKRAKDYGSAAVLLALLFCATTYMTVLFQL